MKLLIAILIASCFALMIKGIQSEQSGKYLPGYEQPPKTQLDVYIEQKAKCVEAGGKIAESNDVRNTSRWRVCVIDGNDIRIE